jgi:hypothetical protein
MRCAPKALTLFPFTKIIILGICSRINQTTSITLVARMPTVIICELTSKFPVVTDWTSAGMYTSAALRWGIEIKAKKN